MVCAVPLCFLPPLGQAYGLYPGSYSHTALRGIQDIGFKGRWAGLRNTQVPNTTYPFWANNPEPDYPGTLGLGLCAQPSLQGLNPHTHTPTLSHTPALSGGL